MELVRILVVDDSASDRELARRTLAHLKVTNEVQMAEDGEEALAQLRSDAPSPHLVLLDLNMPGMGGPALLKEIKADPELRTLRVVILTSSDAEEDVASAYHNDCSGYIRKPVDLDGLVRVIQGIEGYWLAIVRLP